MEKRLRKKTQWESEVLTYGKSGDNFFTEKSCSAIDAIARYYNVKIKTKSLAIIEGPLNKPTIKAITKVTIQ